MWLINRNLSKSYIFLNQGQTHSVVFSLVPRTLEIAFSLKFQNFLSMEHAPTLPHSPRGTGLTALCLYSRLLYSIIIETPESFFIMLSHQQVEIINELEEKYNENCVSEVVDNKKQDNGEESQTATHASGGKYGGLHGVLL